MRLLSFGALILLIANFPSKAIAQCETFFGDLVINEVMPANNSTAADPNGDFDDWIEIFNNTDAAINLEGYFLSDNHGNKTKYVFPNVDIEANQTIVVWCDDEIDQEGLHAPFRLSATGEEVGLYNTDTTTIDYVRYGDMPDDISVGRFPNARGPFRILIPTFNSENTNSVNPGLVINEYQAINESTAQDQWGAFDDWVELYNNSNQPINLTGYFLSDKVGDPTLFEFPDTTIAPDSYMIIWCDQGLMEPGLHTFFKLGSDGDDILLSNADTLTIDYVRFGAQIPDDSEGRLSNGTGFMECMIPSFESNNGLALSSIERDEEKSFKMYPNPASDELNLEFSSREERVVRIYKITGEVILETKLNGDSQKIALTGFSSGMYFVGIGDEISKLIIR